VTTEDYIRHEVDGRLSRIVLDRPEAANRIHSTMMRQLIGALEAASAAGSDVVLITAAGRDFSVGRDQHEVLPDGFSKLDNTRLIVDANRALTGFPGITVAATQGRALGFGCGVVVQSDIALAAASAELGFDEVHHGTAPAFVMSYLEDHVGPKRALDLVVTGRTLSAAQAEQWGIVTRVVAPELLTASAEELVAGLLRSPGELLARCKTYLRENRTVPPADRLEHAFETFARRMRAAAQA
jgi:enoyl-CoA hydratase/carnithine racemase